MPPQYESTWGPTLSLPGTEDFASMDLFNVFEDLNLSFDDNQPLFGDLLPECDLPDMMDELLGSLSQVRHDCMWAGTCVEDKERPSPLDRLQQESPSPVKAVERVRDTHHDVPIPSVQSKTSTVKCNQRSILRTNHNLSASSTGDQLRTTPSEESDDSGRPETPQSMTSETDVLTDGPIFKHEEQDLGSSFQDEDDTEEEIEEEEIEEEDDEDDDDEDDEIDSLAVPVSDVTGQTVRTSYHQQGYESSEGLHRGHASRFDSRPQQTMSNHFFNDHSYHLSKSDVSASIPGNLTPSDSGELACFISVGQLRQFVAQSERRATSGRWRYSAPLGPRGVSTRPLVSALRRASALESDQNCVIVVLCCKMSAVWCSSYSLKFPLFVNYIFERSLWCRVTNYFKSS